MTIGLDLAHEYITLIKARLVLATRGRVEWDVAPIWEGLNSPVDDAPTAYRCRAVVTVEGWTWQGESRLTAELIEMDGVARAALYLATHLLDVLGVWLDDIRAMDDDKPMEMYSPATSQLMAVALALWSVNDTGLSQADVKALDTAALAAYVAKWTPV